MGLLHKLWDDTLAGPTPESGLGKLRRCHSSIPSSSLTSSPASLSSPTCTPSTPIFSPTSTLTSHLDDVPISRSITILKTATSRNSSANSRSVPSSPSSSSAGSPFSPFKSRGEEKKRLTRRKSTLETLERAEPRSPSVYDWVVICALDR